MDEDDFVLSGDEEAPVKEGEKREKSLEEEQIAAVRDITKLSSKEKRLLLKKQHPELLPIISYFVDIVKDLKLSTDIATKAVMETENAAEVSFKLFSRYTSAFWRLYTHL